MLLIQNHYRQAFPPGAVMRWFKHFTDASDDEKIAAIEAEFGLVGYARYWKILETVGKQIKKGQTDPPSVAYPWAKWESILGAKRKQLVCFLEATEKQTLCFLEANENVLRITVPKLLEIKDEYTKKSGQTPERVRTIDVDVDTEEEKEEKFNAEEAFEHVWSQYPNRIGKKKALSHFRASVRSLVDVDRILKALRRYENHIRVEKKGAFIQNGSTWFNNWEDWESYEPAKLSVATPVVSDQRPAEVQTFLDKLRAGGGK